uniref:Transcriptional repressor TCF25 n=1 Tax=Candidatus Kentrum sp. LFY TaxID=2126342 RepID=A0A450WD98_9GAMM|nr:MAG: Transcriptional repressor TCF25 [Candidatus Kentron sp. LFY]
MLELINVDGDDWVFRDSRASSLVDELDQGIDSCSEGQYELGERLFRGVIEKHPHYIEAFHYLSMLYQQTSRELEAYLCIREAVRIGLSVIPKEFSWETSKLDWFSHDNRPFLRAYHHLGLHLERRNEVDEAIAIFLRMLSVCPEDGICVRHLLPELWLAKGDIQSVIRHCEDNLDDASPDITYTHPLALVMLGKLDEARALLIEAKSQLPLVAKELKKKRHTEPKSTSLLPGTITHGGADQAYEYWVRYGKYWLASKEAMALIASI